jgi:hypothetical protein
MLWEHAGALLTRLCFSGPLLYIGLSMAIDPKGFVALVEVLSHTLRRFEQRLHGPDWKEPFREPLPVNATPRARIAVRLTGVVFAIFALVVLVGAGPTAGD